MSSLHHSKIAQFPNCCILQCRVATNSSTNMTPGEITLADRRRRLCASGGEFNLSANSKTFFFLKKALLAVFAPVGSSLCRLNGYSHPSWCDHGVIICIWYHIRCTSVLEDVCNRNLVSICVGSLYSTIHCWLLCSYPLSLGHDLVVIA